MASRADRVRRRTEFLRRLPFFEGLPDEDLQRLCRMAREVEVSAGHLVMQEGTPGDGLRIIVEGELEVTKREGGQEVALALRGPGEFIGEMSLLEQLPRTASVRAIRDSVLLLISPEEFQRLLAGSPSAATSILRTVAGRLRSTEALLMQREKLASLGTLAAGLAHELNNPAAAIGRSAEHLRATFHEWEAQAAKLGALTFDPTQAEHLEELKQAVEQCGAPSSDALASNREEQDLADWLEELAIEDPWEVAPSLAAYGFTRERLEAIAGVFDREQLPEVVGWLSSGLAARGLLDEIRHSAEMISGIVKAVKTYSYLDQAPLQEVDVAQSLESTLMILRHRLAEGVRVVRNYAPGLPPIEAYGSELNQVWTNLVDNAIDAMEGEGTLELSAGRTGEQVEVRIVDTGSGIPDELLPRIFDPFLTTKPPGAGSGLGLHIAYNIVVNRHRGRIEVASRPGRTAFRVLLPIRRSRPAQEAAGSGLRGSG